MMWIYYVAYFILIIYSIYIYVYSIIFTLGRTFHCASPPRLPHYCKDGPFECIQALQVRKQTSVAMRFICHDSLLTCLIHRICQLYSNQFESLLMWVIIIVPGPKVWVTESKWQWYIAKTRLEAPDFLVLQEMKLDQKRWNLYKI